MAKKAAARADMFINRYRGTMTFSADASVVVTESFNTGMNVGQTASYKWVVTHFAVWPSGNTHAAPYHTSDCTLMCQLAVGTVAAILAADDAQVICEGHVAACLGADTTSWAFFPWPLVGFLPSPVPVYASTLTVLLQATADADDIASKTFAYEIGYVTAGVNDREIMEYYAAYGQV